MGDYLIDGEILSDIADKIRENDPDTYEGNTITPEEMPAAVDNVWQAGYSRGTGSGSSKAIIDVTELPTENINEEAFYRVPVGTFYWLGNNTNWACIVVETLPSEGESATTDMENFTLYYETTSNSVSGYVGETLGEMLGGYPSGWYPIEALAQLMEAEWNGVVFDETDISQSGITLLVEHTLYQYKNGWLKVGGSVGYVGTGYGAEIFNTTRNDANGWFSHAEGYMTFAGGDYSHAEGCETGAEGHYSHAEGRYTTAKGDYQHVQGYYNVLDDEHKYAHIIGNGFDGPPSNAHTIDWQGNGWFAGTIKVGGTGQDDENAKELVSVGDVTLVNTWASTPTNLGIDDGILAWDDAFVFFGKKGKSLASGTISHKIPLLAGNNIKFDIAEKDETTIGQDPAFRVNLADNVTLKGSYPLALTRNTNEYKGTAYIIPPELASGSINLYAPTKSGTIALLSDLEGLGGSADNVASKFTIAVEGSTTVWDVLSATQEAGANLGEWNLINTVGHIQTVIGVIYQPFGNGSFGLLKASNLMKLDTVADVKDWATIPFSNFIDEMFKYPTNEMPQIRFTTAHSQYLIENEGHFDGVMHLCDEDNPLKFTVEIVGGGALQVGDTLQLCTRGSVMGSQANGFRAKYKLRKFAEYEITEGDLNKRYLTVATHEVGGDLPKVLYHDGRKDNSSLSPIYIRIRRPKGNMQNNDSGKTVDATFSNIVTVWKTYNRPSRQIKIL